MKHNLHLIRSWAPAVLLMILLKPLSGVVIGDVALSTPRRLQVVGVEGRPLQIQAQRLDREGIHGEEGLVPWSTVRPREASRLYLQLMDRGEGEDWLDLAWILLVHPHADRQDLAMAREHLAQAARKLPEGEARVETLKQQAESHRRVLQEKASKAQRDLRQKLGTEARSWPGTPWPESTQQMADERMARLRAWIADKLQTLSPDREVVSSGKNVRTRHALIISDQPRTDLHDIGLQIDHIISDLNMTFGPSIDERPFGSRLGILLLADTDSYDSLNEKLRTIQIDALPRAQLQVLEEGRGDLVILVDGSRIAEAMPALRHELVHAWMHRLHSPIRPPAWFNEGLAHAVAWWRTSPAEQSWRPAAVNWLRTQPVNSLVEQGYEDGKWNTTGIDTAAAGLLVRRMLQSDNEATVDWLKRIKRGEAPDQAFEKAFRLTVEQQLSLAVRYWKLND